MLKRLPIIGFMPANNLSGIHIHHFTIWRCYADNNFGN